MAVNDLVRGMDAPRNVNFMLFVSVVELRGYPITGSISNAGWAFSLRKAITKVDYTGVFPLLLYRVYICTLSLYIYFSTVYK